MRLSDVRTRTELAAQFAVDVRAINVVSLSNSPCRNPSCILPAAQNNNKRCICCQQTWFPRIAKAGGTKSDNAHGYGLFGPQFMREYDGKLSKKACCCQSDYCQKIGYSHMGMMSLLKDRNLCMEATAALGIDVKRRQQISASPQNFRVAPWHYDLRHRIWDGGKWKARKLPFGKK